MPMASNAIIFIRYLQNRDRDKLLRVPYKYNPIVDYIVKSNADIVCLQETDAYGKQRDYIYKVLAKAYPSHDFVSMPAPGHQHMMLFMIRLSLE